MYNLIGAYSCQFYVGEKRSGKTFTMTYDTFMDIQKLDKATRKKITIYSNFKLNKKFFPDVKLKHIDKEDLETYYKDRSQFINCIFLIDEIHAWVDSRGFMKDFNKHFSYFMGQVAKRGNVLRATTHSMDFIDIRARHYTDLITFVYKGWYPRKNKFQIILNYNEELTKDDEKKLVIKREDMVRKMVVRNKGYFGALPEYVQIRVNVDFINHIYKYFGMYNTDEFIES